MLENGSSNVGTEHEEIRPDGIVTCDRRKGSSPVSFFTGLPVAQPSYKFGSVFPGPNQSRSQRPRSFWSATGIGVPIFPAHDKRDPWGRGWAQIALWRVQRVREI